MNNRFPAAPAVSAGAWSRTICCVDIVICDCSCSLLGLECGLSNNNQADRVAGVPSSVLGLVSVKSGV